MRSARFVRTTLCSGAIVATAVFAFIALVDPHDNLALSPPVLRAPINTNQRFLVSEPGAVAGVRRRHRRHLDRPAPRPPRLDRELEGKFVNLAMNSATAYEQSRILELFVRHRPVGSPVRNLIVGIDVIWCTSGAIGDHYTPRPFPEWMYDENPWNDYLHVFNDATLEQAVRQVQFWLGFRKERYGFDGYENFLPADAEYDLAKARRNIYGASDPSQFVPPPSTARALAPEALSFDRHRLLERMLRSVPQEARKILFIVPVHVFGQPRAGTRAAGELDACKQHLTELADAIPETYLLDFMISSEITRADSNYWDTLHFNVGVAERITRLIGAAVRDRAGVETFSSIAGAKPVRAGPGFYCRFEGASFPRDLLCRDPHPVMVPVRIVFPERQLPLVEETARGFHQRRGEVQGVDAEALTQSPDELPLPVGQPDVRVLPGAPGDESTVHPVLRGYEDEQGEMLPHRGQALLEQRILEPAGTPRRRDIVLVESNRAIPDPMYFDAFRCLLRIVLESVAQ